MDRHTLLANKSLGMSICLLNTKWPAIFLTHGYKIHGIEHNVHVKGRNVSPDIILTSAKARHALVIDCKSGANVDLWQDRMYAQMSTGDLHGAGVPALVRSHAPIYTINEEHVGRIRSHTSHPLVVFGSRSVYGIGDFGNSGLTAELCGGCPLEEGSAPDTEIYPFSVRDAQDDIDACVARAVSRHLLVHPDMRGGSLASRAAASAILRQAHPLHEFFSGSHRSELRRAVAQSISRQEKHGARWLEPAGRGDM